jgi:hypothetical protein
MSDLTRERLIEAARQGWSDGVRAHYDRFDDAPSPAERAVDAVLALLAEDAEQAHDDTPCSECAIALARYADRLRSLRAGRQT